MIDLELTDNLDLKIENGDLITTQDTLLNEVLVATTTNSLDIGMDYNLGGWMNEDIGNRIWVILYQNRFNSETRSEIKSELRQSLIDYGNIEYSVINSQEGTISAFLDLILNNGLRQKFDLIMGDKNE